MSTLILRDATLAICGAPESRLNPSRHLATRVPEVQAMDPALLQECMQVILEVNGLGEDADIELLIALMIIGVAKPDICEAHGFTGLATGRRVASRLEQQGHSDAALALIEELRTMYPGHQALERDYDAVLGRLGMVLNLADRYYDRAQQLLASGDRAEAVGWLREVLLLDASRRDVARQIRDLRLDEMRIKGKFKLRWGLLVLGIFAPLSVVGVVYREIDLGARYASLPAAQANDLESSNRRLSALELFAEEHPVWHGSISLKRERTDLRLEVNRLALLDQNRRQELLESIESQRVMADSLRHQARRNVGSERFKEALSLYEQARSLAPSDWKFAEETDRDMATIRAHIADLDSDKDSR